MKNLILILIIFISLTSCKEKNSNAQTGFELQKIKSTEGFQTPESVLFSEADNAIFVSNINGKPAQVDSNGFISKLDAEGNIITLKWATGLNAPKGMGILDGFLYVTDIHDLVKIDIETGKIAERIPVKGAYFLNDIAVSPEGDIYISDSGNGNVYMYSNGKITTIASKLTSPNGLLWQNDTLFIGCVKNIYVYTPQNKQTTKFCNTAGMTDGLKRIDNQIFITSDWEGNIYIVNSKDNTQTLLLKKVNGKNAADFELINKTDLLFVPTFFDNKIDIYQLKATQ